VIDVAKVGRESGRTLSLCTKRRKEPTSKSVTAACSRTRPQIAEAEQRQREFEAKAAEAEAAKQRDRQAYRERGWPSG
jgi:hypothetical protein